MVPILMLFVGDSIKQCHWIVSVLFKESEAGDDVRLNIIPGQTQGAQGAGVKAFPFILTTL